MKMTLATMTTAKLMEKRAAIGEELTKANARVKELNEQKMEVDSAIMAKADSEEVPRLSNGDYTASISTEDYPQVLDWEAFYEHILATREFSLLQRRPSAAAYRETVKIDGQVPGVETRTIRKVSFRKNN